MGQFASTWGRRHGKNRGVGTAYTVRANMQTNAKYVMNWAIMKNVIKFVHEPILAGNDGSRSPSAICSVDVQAFPRHDIVFNLD